MKQLLYVFAAFCVFGLASSCRKSGTDLTIKQFDQNQIQDYISQHGITGMTRDTSGGDTTGIYYQIITPGKGDVIQYFNKTSYVFSFSTFDGKYNSSDTIINHSNAYSAYIAPNGVQLAIKNLVKRKGGKIRILIPSRLAYGVNGLTLTSVSATTGTTVSGTISGNQCLDYVINVIDDSKQAAYDDISIQKYITAKGLTGFQSDGKGSYYKVTQAGTGTVVPTISSTLGVEYTGTMFNGTVFDAATTNDGTAAASFTLYDVIPAWQSVLTKKDITAGALVTMLVPSHAAYGQDANNQGSTTIPAFTCLRFDLIIVSVTN